MPVRRALAIALLAGATLVPPLGISVCTLMWTAPPASADAGASTTTSTSSTTSTTSTTAPRSTTTSTSSTTSTTLTPDTTPATLPGSGAPLPPPGAEIPSDEAALLGLLADVHSRLAELSTEIDSLTTQLTQNQTNLTNANAVLAARQEAVYADDRKVDGIEVAKAAARLSMRERAVAAYMHQPTGDLANMLLHLSDPAQLVDARSFYKTLVDVQVNAIKTYDALDKAAKQAAKDATAARDAAVKQQKTVANTQAILTTLRTTLIQIQATSHQQEQQQTDLLGQIGKDRAQFEAELQAQEQESASITELLASLSQPGDTTASPTGGYFDFPIPGAPINQPFGPNHDPFTGAAGFHPGVDFGAKMGTPIHAAGDGIVVFAGVESGYGNYTCINHGHNVATCYAHQSVLLVKVGDQVKRDQVIGLVGTTGYSTGPHLHFEVRINGQVVDPMPWLTAGGATTTTKP